MTKTLASLSKKCNLSELKAEAQRIELIEATVQLMTDCPSIREVQKLSDGTVQVRFPSGIRLRVNPVTMQVETTSGTILLGFHELLEFAAFLHGSVEDETP